MASLVVLCLHCLVPAKVNQLAAAHTLASDWPHTWRQMARAPGSIRDHHNHTTPPDCTPDSIQPKQLSQLGQPYEPISLIATLHGQLPNIPSTSQDPHRQTSYSKSSPAGHRSSQAPVCAVHQSWATPPAKSWTTSSKVPIVRLDPPPQASARGLTPASPAMRFSIRLLIPISFSRQRRS